MKTAPHFLIVDDDPINNIICKTIIKTALPEATINDFTDPEKGLSFIETEYLKPEAPETILLLDINMPAISGWQFLDYYRFFKPTIKNHINIYINSSSVDPLDKVKAQEDENVMGYIVKPLTKEMILRLIEPLK